MINPVNHLIAPEFGCPTEKKECSETALNIHLNYTDDDGSEFSKSFPLLSKIDFIGKKSPTGGIISNYKVTPFSVLGYRMKEHVATVVYAGSSGEKDIYRKMTTEQVTATFYG